MRLPTFYEQNLIPNWGIFEKLGETGLITIAELARRLNFAADETALAAGWLARENKIYIERRNGLLYIRKE